MIGVVAVVLFAITLVFGTFAYGITRKHWEGPATRTFARLVSFPAGRVGSHTALYTDFLAQTDAQAIYLKTEDAKSRHLPSEVNDQTRKAAFDQIMQIATLDQLAEENQVSITPLDVDRAFSDFEANAGTSTQPGEIDDFLKHSFGWTRDDFKRYFIRPGVLSQALRAKMSGTTEDQKSQALQKALDERMTKPDVKKYLILPET